MSARYPRLSFRSRKAFLTSLITLLLVIFIGYAQSQGWLQLPSKQGILHTEPGSYRIAHFIDGDTIQVEMSGKVETVRFIGIDTPETHKPNTPVQCYGPAASAYTKNRIRNQRVRLVSDSLTTNRDRYDRLLRYVVLEDGTELNYELVAKGYAFAYSFPFSKKDSYFAAMDKAKSEKLGLWGNCNPYQKSTGQWQTESAS